MKSEKYIKKINNNKRKKVYMDLDIESKLIDSLEAFIKEGELPLRISSSNSKRIKIKIFKSISAIVKYYNREYEE